MYAFSEVLEGLQGFNARYDLHLEILKSRFKGLGFRV